MNYDYDYIGRADDEAVQDAKNKFADFIIGLESRLDSADEFGKNGDIRMLAELRELTDVKEDIEALAKQAEEDIPGRDYHAEVTKLLKSHLEHIIEIEIQKIAEFLETNSDGRQEATSRINQLQNIVHFYSELYPELNLSRFGEKINSLLE